MCGKRRPDLNENEKALRDRLGVDPDWTPRSAFWKDIMARAQHKMTHKEVLIPCQHCGENVVIRIAVDTDT